ncbi:hypothetical protein CVV68_12190 [Arthrobacter livingstonensis]|uniref:Uncharacterized protein n=1 Tax=Arthrobacter livingstonensis TaxID=670078 RepID=A0A2V5L5Q5_9MICC|nr:hypothetical protein [Arthrobacter livingstonensis]PYI66851.1 hypothetical protein CVV68_12190 [Arthrobacter livingstonensis]
MSIWPTPMMSADKTLNELPVDERSLQRWQESLAALERDADAALGLPAAMATLHENTLHEKTRVDTWEPPVELGPLPQIFVERARALASLQQRAAARLAAARADVEHELAELTRPRRQVQPVYVDVTG